ncbi:MAG: NAD-dependent epimerase/dehydratase family protein, partial [Candidatus Gastranaerophilales bacterium]|nr:NAD-dependent epimerase/dehydratase family protein [Candidatus Gastranaerophilales bacterium]
EVFLWGDGCVYREFMASNDLADACIYLLKNYNQKEIGDIVNITSGNDIKLSELFELMKKIVQYDGNIKYDNSKPSGTYRKLLDDNKIKSLGWKPKIDLETGIKNLYDWYVKTTL